jgi:hypothetical protein
MVEYSASTAHLQTAMLFRGKVLPLPKKQSAQTGAAETEALASIASFAFPLLPLAHPESGRPNTATSPRPNHPKRYN